VSRRRSPPPSDLQRLDALLRDPSTHAQAEAIPEKKTGRPRAYPPYMWVVFEAAVSIWGSARNVEAQFADPRVWRFARHTIKGLFPNEPLKWLPEIPMRRCHYLYARRYLADPDVLERRREIFRAHAIALARLIGLLEPDGPSSLTHPDVSRMVHGDGKVIEPLFKGKRNETRVDRRTGEIVPMRCDPDASNHVEGDGEEVYGTKFLIVSARNPEHRVVLDTRYVPFSGEGGEAGVALRSFASIAPQAPGVIGVVWDMALRGVHIDRAMRELGWLTVTRVPAKRNYARRGQRGGRRIEKERLIELKNVKRDDGEEVTIRLLAKNGALGIGALQDNGETRFVPLKRIRTQRQKDKVGYRFYNQYAMPQGYATREITVRLHNSAEEEARRLKRAENLRAIPPGDPDFDRLYARRGDAESLNRTLEDSLYLKKAHSLGHLRQEADLLGFAQLVNSITLARHRARECLKQAA
jgi:hypothetical protein